MVMFSQIILTFHSIHVNCFFPVLHRILYPSFASHAAVDWVSYKFMDVIVDDLMIIVDSVQTEVRQIDTFVLQMVGSNSQEDFILRLSEMRQRIAGLQELLLHKREM